MNQFAETYKAPSRKIPVKETLILLVTCRFHIIGSGIIRNLDDFGFSKPLFVCSSGRGTGGNNPILGRNGSEKMTYTISRIIFAIPVPSAEALTS